jgi:hypothetical protein
MPGNGVGLSDSVAGWKGEPGRDTTNGLGLSDRVPRWLTGLPPVNCMAPVTICIPPGDPGCDPGREPGLTGGLTGRDPGPDPGLTEGGLIGLGACIMAAVDVKLESVLRITMCRRILAVTKRIIL